MVETRLILAGLWIALMLTYLLGDVLRIFAGDFVPGRLAKGVQATPLMWLLIAIVMLIPIVMIVLTLTVDASIVRWLTILAAGFLVVFNLAGLPYPGAYDNVLIIFSLGLSALTIWYAWTWAI